MRTAGLKWELASNDFHWRSIQALKIQLDHKGDIEWGIPEVTLSSGLEKQSKMPKGRGLGFEWAY